MKDTPQRPEAVFANPAEQGTTYLLLHGAPGGNSRQFQIAAQTHAEEIRGNAVPEWMGPIRRFSRVNDTLAVVHVRSGYDINEALTAYRNIAYLAYFGHSGPFCLYAGLHTDEPGKCLTAQYTNEFLYDTEQRYQSELAAMRARPYSLFGPEPRFAPARFYSLLYQAGMLRTSNVLPEGSINLFGCSTGDYMSGYAAREREAVHPANPLGNICIAQQLANHFGCKCRGFGKTIFFTDNEAKGHGREAIHPGDLTRMLPGSAKRLWILPAAVGRKAAFIAFRPVGTLLA